MKFGAQLDAFGKSERKATLALARALGCEGLEVSMRVAPLRGCTVEEAPLVARAAVLRADLAEAGLDCISLSPGLLLSHAQAPAIVAAVGRVAEALGTRTVRMFFAPHVRWGGPGSLLTDWLADFDGTRDARYWLERNARELSTLLELAAPFNLRFAFELHHGFVVNSASAAMRLLDRHPPDRVGIIMDPGNMVFEGHEGWRNAVQIMGEYLAYLHCKNAAYTRVDGKWAHEWAALDEGIAHYGEIITALKDIAFQGYLCVEDLRRSLTPEAKIGGGIAMLRALVKSDVRVMPA